MISASVVGGSGYIGGELLRLLIFHPEVKVAAVTSRRFAGRRVDGVHPNLRGHTDAVFTDPARLGGADVVFLAVPHGEAMAAAETYMGLATTLIDLSADFRLRDPEVFARYYKRPHQAADLLATFVPGLPELNREALRTADRISMPGCMATAAMLGLHPLAAAGLLTGDVVVDGRTGSSGSGSTAGPENLHAERSGAMRVFAPLRHRHEAEISQAIGRPARMTATGVEAVRGVQVVCRVELSSPLDDRAARAVYREAYRDEPFIRYIVHSRGMHRLPEPKILAGTNYCDVGCLVDSDGRRAVVIAALDNLVKGAAGNAVQAMNVRLGLSERTGLEFPGLHPN